MTAPQRRISDLLSDLGNGDRQAVSRLLPVVYAELRRLAAHYMRGERPGQTLQPTELVHEAYLRLVGHREIAWQGHSHFFALAAISMRRILVDRARQKKAVKHGGGEAKVELDHAVLALPEKPEEILALDAALDRLAELSPRQSRVVELKFFGGLEVEEIAAVEGVSARTVKRDWSLARVWLHREIAKGG